MAYLNHVTLLGNLTRTPKTSFTPSGKEVVDFGLAVNRYYKDKSSGEGKEETLFIDAKAWEGAARIIAERLSKGSRVLIEGRLKLDQWKASDGSSRSKHYVIVENVQILDAPQSSAGDAPDFPMPPARANGDNTQDSPARTSNDDTRTTSNSDSDVFSNTPGMPPSWDDDSGDADTDDDIPF